MIRPSSMRVILGVWGLAALASCAGSPAPAEAPSELDRRLLEIARDYPDFGVVDTKFSWVQLLCRVYEPPARYSASKDAATHGDKLYLLYAKNWEAYVNGILERQPVGQVIVKEAWDARVSDTHSMEGVGFTDIDGQTSQPETRPVRAEPVQRNGKWHYPEKRHALFIMLKTDEGWRYGTVSGDRTQVYKSGVIRSCASCHEKAGPDSLFGLPGRARDR